MAELVFPHSPNRVTQVIAGADTSWHKVTIPTDIPLPSGVVNITVAMVTVNAAGAAPGSLCLVDFDKATSPAVGFPILGGQTLVFGYNNSIWYKLSVATDQLYLIYAF